LNSKPKKALRNGAKITLTPKTSPALKELLDHLAYDLAQEYLRLMRKTDGEGGNNRKGKPK
jgi:hypothetical protein